MTASFPDSIKSFTAKVDNVDTVMAADVNSAYDEITAIETALGSGYGSPYNDCINGNFVIAQRGTTFTAATVPVNSDDTYLLDRWILLSDGNDIVDVSQETSVIPTGSEAAIKLEIETQNKMFGIFQVLESNVAKKYAGGKMSVSFKARMGASDDFANNLKCYVLSWVTPTDGVTSDCVQTWGATITPASGWTAENTPTSCALSTDYQTFEVENVSIDTASMTNIGVFICVDRVGQVDDLVYITDVKITKSTVATPFVPRLYAEEEQLCMRYYQKSFVRGTAPAQNAGVNGATRVITTVAGANTNYSTSIPLAVPMRTAPTLTTYNPSAANAQVRNLNTSADATNTTISATSGSCIYINWTGDAGGTVGARCIVHWTAESEL